MGKSNLSTFLDRVRKNETQSPIDHGNSEKLELIYEKSHRNIQQSKENPDRALPAVSLGGAALATEDQALMADVLAIPSLRRLAQAELCAKCSIPLKAALKSTYQKLLKEHDHQVKSIACF